MSPASETPDIDKRHLPRRWMIASVPAILLVALLTYWLYPRPRPAEEDPFPIPALSASPYLNTKSDVSYVGSESCRICHPQEHASFRRTGMGRSMAAIDPKQLPTDAVFDHEVSKRRYQVHRQDARLWHRESFLTGTNEVVLNDVPLTYVVGSGAHAQTFLTEIDGFLVESPVTWYSSRKAWGMSPGYDRAEHAGFQRPVSEACLYCHAGRFEVIEKSHHRIRIDEPAISCERCHGPGELHVQHHAPGQPARPVAAVGDITIVNPARLPRALAEAVCQQCHLQGSATVPARGRKPSDFRPGLLLEEFRHDYRLEVDDVPVKVVGHVEQLRLSRCYQASAMTCLTCHNPHHEPEPAQRHQYYQDACLKCHTLAQCTVDAKHREKQSPENRCVRCHMPQATTEVEHVAFTHHRIGKQFQSTRAPSQHAGELRPVLTLPTMAEVDRYRSLGLGYLEAANRSKDQAVGRGYARKALDLLTTARAAGLRDSLLDAGLADAHSLLNLDATKYAEEALTHPDLPARERCAVMFQHAQTRAKQSRLDEAIAMLHELQKSRRMALDYLTLADCERTLGNTGKSIVAFENAVRINPRLWKVQRLLSEHYRRLGNSDKAAWHEARAVP